MKSFFLVGNSEKDGIKRALSNLENEIKIISTYNQKISKQVTDYYDRLWTNRDGDFTLPYDTEKNEKRSNDLILRFLEVNGIGAF